MVLRLCLGSSLLYIGGMFLNDVCDVAFDREFRRERPIPSGALNRGIAIAVSLVLFIGAFLLLRGINGHTGFWAVGLTILIIVYDFTHKRIRFAPILMAGCRFLLYLTAASAGLVGISSRALFFGVLLGIYVAGLSYVARGESRQEQTFPYSWLRLFAPIAGALVFDYSGATALGCLPLFLCISSAIVISRKDIGAAVALLLAGIVLLDLIAISANSLLMITGWLALFGLTLLFQKYIPAT